jgi:hypothetical protein
MLRVHTFPSRIVYRVHFSIPEGGAGQLDGPAFARKSTHIYEAIVPLATDARAPRKRVECANTARKTGHSRNTSARAKNRAPRAKAPRKRATAS